MPTGSFNEDQSSLYQVAKAALPPEFFQNGQDSQELPSAFAVEMAAAKASIDTDYHRSMILDSTGIWLDQHARDRGTTRQANESNVQLRQRLRSFNPSVTLSALTGAIGAFVTGSDVTGTVGYVELRKSRAFFYTNPFVLNTVSASLITAGQSFKITRDGLNIDTFVFGTTGSSPPGTWYVDLSSASFPYDVAKSAASAISSASLAGTVTGLSYQTRYDSRWTSGSELYVYSDPFGVVLRGSDQSACSITVGSNRGYFNDGWRMGGIPPLNELIIILPTGSSGATFDGVKELARQLKAAGTNIVVEEKGLRGP